MDDLSETPKLENMAADDDLEWIREGLRKPGKTRAGLAHALGRYPSAVTDLFKRQRELKLREALAIADYLEVDLPPRLASPNSIVPIAGQVGAGAEITSADDPSDPLEQIEVQWSLKEPMVAFEIIGESMMPRYDPGWAVICYREGRSPEQVAGEEAVIRLTDGRRFLKRLIPAGNRFHLESTNAKLIENVEPEWIGEIHVVVPPKQFRKIKRLV
jgi:repressor LexA